MPTFDPTKPAANSEVSSAELRDQLNALNNGLTAATGSANNANNEIAYLNNNIASLSLLTTNYTDPVSAANLNEIRDALNAIVKTLQS
jgi:hypothetical protein